MVKKNPSQNLNNKKVAWVVVELWEIFSSKKRILLKNVFLHDYAFELLEKELEARGKLYTPCNTDTIEDIIDKSFIRIKGKIFFNDYKASTDTLLNFNTLGEGLGYIQYFDNSGKVKDELKELTNKAKDREQRNKVGLLKKEIDKRFEEYLKGNGLRLDEKWLESFKKYRVNTAIKTILKSYSLLLTIFYFHLY